MSWFIELIKGDWGLLILMTPSYLFGLICILDCFLAWRLMNKQLRKEREREWAEHFRSD